LIATIAAKDARTNRILSGLTRAEFSAAIFAARRRRYNLFRLGKRRKAMSEKHFVQQITIDEQIAEVKREIAMRNKVYPKWIEAGSLPKAKADFQIRAMEAVLISLQDLAKKTAPQAGLF